MGIANTAFGLSPFKPRTPWLTGDLQTLRNSIMMRDASVVLGPARHFNFIASNQTDRLSGFLHEGDADKPLVIVMHGLTGSADGNMIRASAHALIGAGYPVLRINLRGAGDTAPYCATQYHTGLTADLEALIIQLPLECSINGIVLYGFSLSGNQVLKFAAERRCADVVRGVMSVCGPIDLLAAIECLEKPRNRIYSNSLLREMKAQALKCSFTAEKRERVMTAQSIREFDDFVTAPIHGFSNALDFYEMNSSAPILSNIIIPTVALTAANDPWIPVAGYQAVDWKNCKSVTPVISSGGGHCGFHGLSSRVPWHNLLMLRFLDTLCSSHPYSG